MHGFTSQAAYMASDRKVTARTLGLPSYASTITSVGLTIAHDPLSSVHICSLGFGSRSCLRCTTERRLSQLSNLQWPYRGISMTSFTCDNYKAPALHVSSLYIMPPDADDLLLVHCTEGGVQCHIHTYTHAPCGLGWQNPRSAAYTARRAPRLLHPASGSPSRPWQQVNVTSEAAITFTISRLC